MNQSSENLKEIFQKIPNWIKAALGLLTSLIGFALLVQDNYHLGLIISLGFIFIVLFACCIYFSFTKTPPLIEGGKGVYRYPKGRKWTNGILFILLFILFLTFALKPIRIFIKTAFVGSPTPTIPPSSVQLPTIRSDKISVVIQPKRDTWAGLVTESVDRSIMIQDLQRENIDFESWGTTSRIALINIPETTWLVITGESESEIIQISNQVPIRLVSYSFVPNIVDLASMGGGGGGFTWVLAADISANDFLNSDQIVWAKYDSDIKGRVSLNNNAYGVFDSVDYPTELEYSILSDTEPLPDYFTLENDERIVLSIATFFKQPGIYHLQFGVEYLYENNLDIAWAEPAIEFFVPDKYYLWLADGNSPAFFLWKECVFQENYGHECYEHCTKINQIGQQPSIECK